MIETGVNSIFYVLQYKGSDCYGCCLCTEEGGKDSLRIWLEVSKREKNTLMKIQSWEKQKIMFQEKLVAEKQRKAQLQQKLEHATELLDHQEVTPLALFLLVLAAGSLIVNENITIFPSKVQIPSSLYPGLATALINITFVINLLDVQVLCSSNSPDKSTHICWN